MELHPSHPSESLSLIDKGCEILGRIKCGPLQPVSMSWRVRSLVWCWQDIIRLVPMDRNHYSRADMTQVMLAPASAVGGQEGRILILSGHMPTRPSLPSLRKAIIAANYISIFLSDWEPLGMLHHNFQSQLPGWALWIRSLYKFALQKYHVQEQRLHLRVFACRGRVLSCASYYIHSLQPQGSPALMKEDWEIVHWKMQNIFFYPTVAVSS